MSIKDLFIVKEAGPFTVIPGGKPAGEPSDPQGNLYSADEDQSPKGKLLTQLKYVQSKLKDQIQQIETTEDDQQFYRIKLELLDTANDLNWALKTALEEE